jgi:hypothetical protein
MFENYDNDYFLFDLDNIDETEAKIKNKNFYCVYTILLDYFNKNDATRLAKIITETNNIKIIEQLIKNLVKNIEKN